MAGSKVCLSNFAYTENHHMQKLFPAKVSSVSFSISRTHKPEQTKPRKRNINCCMRLAKQVVLKEINKDCNKNVVVSPLSLDAVLNMVAAGSRGRTQEQLLSFLESQGIDEINSVSSRMMALTADNETTSETCNGGPLLSIANGIWTDRRFPLKPSFQDIAKNVFKADTRTVDFFNKADEVVDEVNSWVKDRTKGLIESILSRGSLNRDTMLILANALYFKGAWKNAFDKSMTRDEDFHLLDGGIVRVPFMADYDESYFYGSFDGFKLVKLPYRCGNDNKKFFFMYVFLPDERNGLENLVEKFNSNLELLNQHYSLELVTLSEMWLPKFKFTYKFRASDTMKELGVTLPFQMLGDFKEMVDCLNSDTVFVSDIFQKSCIEVNEEGTEAAAVTVEVMVGSSYGQPPKPSFVADHPFLFMIKEEASGVVFFCGAVRNPLD